MNQAITLIKPKRKYVRKAATIQTNTPKKGPGRPPNATKPQVDTHPHVEDILAILGVITAHLYLK